MALPNSDNLKAKLRKEKENFDQDLRLENLKSSPQLAYKTVKNNKRPYDRKAKLRSFQSEDIVYLYNPNRKPESVLSSTNFGLDLLRLLPNYHT